MGTALRAIPLLAFVVASYAVFAATDVGSLGAQVLQLTLVSGAHWTFTLGDLHIAAGLFLIYIEILKSTRTQLSSVLDHGLSLTLFIICLVLFIVVPAFGTGTFFLITLMTLLDVVAGFTVTIVAAKRDVGVTPGAY